MVLWFSGAVFRRVLLSTLDFGGEDLKVGVDDVRGWELLVVALEGKLVFAIFRHLHPDCTVSNPTALWLVSFREVFSDIAM